MNADTAVNSYHVDEVVEAEEGAHNLHVVLHDHVDAGTDAFSVFEQTRLEPI